MLTWTLSYHLLCLSLARLREEAGGKGGGFSFSVSMCVWCIVCCDSCRQSLKTALGLKQWVRGESQ